MNQVLKYLMPKLMLDCSMIIINNATQPVKIRWNRFLQKLNKPIYWTIQISKIMFVLQFIAQRDLEALIASLVTQV